jgi:hypothetical protein
MLLPHLAAAGCTAEVLTVDPACCNSPLDPWQADHLSAQIPIHTVRGLSHRWSRLPGFGSIDARCHQALARAGSRLLRRRHFDLAYFSTTEFGSFRLGPLWKRRHGVPFVLDYQDPWVNDHYRLHPEQSPPGGRFKYSIADRLHRLQEPRVLHHCSGYTSVSSAYVDQIQQRYPFAATIPYRVLPFPGSAEDFLNLGDLPLAHLPFDPTDGLIHWVSIGRGGVDLHQALAGLFEALARYAPSGLLTHLRLHFLGTSYASAGQGVATIAPLAARYGLQQIVQEVTDRLPLSLTLASLKAADALLVIGSNDPGYTASKIAPYLLAGRPLLAVMHQRSSVVELIQSSGGGVVVSFSEQDTDQSLSSRIAAAWLDSGQHAQPLPLDPVSFAPHTAAGQAKILVQFFRRFLHS